MTKFCNHCRSNQPKETFVEVRDRRTKRLIGRKCAKCKAAKKLPAKVRDERGKNRSIEMNAADSRRSLEARNETLQKRLDVQREERAFGVQATTGNRNRRKNEP